MLETHVTIAGHSRIDFDKRKIRKAMRRLGADVRKEARRLVARRAISSAGEYPGRQTGSLMRSIRAKVSKPGFLVRIQPDKTPEMGADFYPAFLNYGVKGRISKRKNYMTDALNNRSEYARGVLRSALQDALIPRK